MALRRLHPGRLVRIAAALRARGAAMSVGVLPYRQGDTGTLEDWQPGVANSLVSSTITMSGTKLVANHSALIVYPRRVRRQPRSLILLSVVGGCLEQRRGLTSSSTSASTLRERRLTERSLSRMRGRASSLPPSRRAGETFDVVVCNEVLYVVPDADAMLAVAQGALRPGGHLLTSIRGAIPAIALFSA